MNDIRIELDPAKVALDLNRGRENKTVILELEKALEKAAGLWAPQGLYETVEVLALEGETIRIRSGWDNREAALRIGPKADLMAPASRAVVSVSTIGPALEREVARLNKADQMLEGYFLDSVGVIALGEVGRAVRTRVEAMAKEQGLGVGPSMAPGSLVGWPTSGQKDLLSFLDLKAVGVELNSSFVLQPAKSASGFIGMGRDYPSQRVGSVCRYCSLAPTCWRRKEDPV